MSYPDFHHHKPFESNGIYNLNLLETPPNRPFSAGIHPADSAIADAASWEWMEAALQNPFCKAVGECGLDALVNTDLGLQEEVFKKQILLANEAKKPIIIHCVRLFHRLGYFKKLASVPMIVHGFNKKEKTAMNLIQDGFYLSFGKAALHSVSLQETIKKLPLDRIFLETDNSDFNIADLYKKISEVREIDPCELSKAIENNLQTILHQ